MESMKVFLRFFAATVLTISAAAACKEDGPLQIAEGTGVSGYTWEATNEADVSAGILSYTFTAAASWTAESSSPDWCEVVTSSGVAGTSVMRLSLTQNTAADPREATVSIQVDGYPETASFTIVQGTLTSQGDGRYRELNEWTYGCMEEYYLWNEPVPDLVLDYSLDYQSFLTSMLEGIAACDDVNHDDGYWKDSKRDHWYTRMSSAAPITRSGESTRGLGFAVLQPMRLNYQAIGVAVMAVTPDSPADRAGIMRGDFITQVNGTYVTENNYVELTRQLYSGPATVLVNSVYWEGADPVLYPRESQITLEVEDFFDPSVYKYETTQTNRGQIIGYMLHMGFSCACDTHTLGVFDEFRREGVTDLILDLRYNSGGDVLSSAFLATLIAGSEYKGQTFTKITFNAERTAAGESGIYKIGDKETYEGTYDLLETALQHSLNLKRVYVITTSTTASASELIINGLRGLGIEVRIIGMPSNGKNVGMEGFQRTFRSYDFLFYPVTFYCENAEGFKEYSDGFKPDVEVDDNPIYPCEFNTRSDAYSLLAREWIYNGVQPDPDDYIGDREPSSSPRRLQTVESPNRRMGGSLVHRSE